MKTRKGQGEVITTVLIILLVLAAVFIVWTAVRNMITKSTDTTTAKANCLGVQLNVEGVTNTSSALSVRVSREADDGSAISAMKIIAVKASDSTEVANCDETTAANLPGVLGEKTITCNYKTGFTAATLGNQKLTVKVAPKLGTTQCDVLASADFTP